VLLPEARLPAPVAPRCVGTQTPPRERRRGEPSRAARDGAWPNSTCVTGSVCCHMCKLQEPKLATPRRGRPATPGRTALARQDADIPPQVLQRGIDQISRGIILIPVRRQSPARLPAAEMERSYAAGRSARHDLLRPHDQGGVDVFLADPPPAVFLRHAENGDDFAGPAGKDCPVLNGDFPALFGLPQHVAVEDLHGHLVLHEEHADAMSQRITHLTYPPLKRRRFQRESLVAQTEGGQEMPRGKKFTAEQIIGKVNEAEVGLAQGKTVPEVVRKLGVTEQTYYRWKREYGGLRTDQAKRLKDSEKENARLKRLLADAELDKAILREAASGRPLAGAANF
jgi:putative transposase